MDQENINKVLLDYKTEITLSHMGLPADSFHITRANAMKQVLYKLELLNDNTNHEIVKAAIKKAVNDKRRAR